MTSEFVFHIRNAHPGDMAALLAILCERPELGSAADIVKTADLRGFVILDRQRLEALTTARDLGLVERERNVLTADGQTVAQMESYKPHLFIEVIHGLQYTLWKQQQQGGHCFSWSYRALCEMLWQRGTVDVDRRRELASEVETRARTVFNRSDIAFSPKSVGGALLWLAALEPNVLVENGKRFVRRDFCSPELLLLAVDHVYQSEQVEYGANMLLTDALRDAICQFCLLEPHAFERVLEYANGQFDYLEKGLGGGWGRYLVLRRAPMLADFL